MSQNHKNIPLSDYMFQKASRFSIPFSGTFELSPVCNFACQMCYVRKTAKEVQKSSRPILNIEQWIEIARNARDEGMLYLLLTGGEPFLWPDFWKLYEELIKMGLLVSINTNGSLIDNAAIEQLKRLPPKRINITLYGARDETYEALCGTKKVFSKVDYAIASLREAGIPVKLNCSLTPENACDLDKIVAYSQKHGLVLQVATYMFPPVRRDETMVGKNKRFTPAESAFYRLEAYRLQYGDKAYFDFLQSILGGNASPPGLDESCVDPIDGKIRCRAGKASFWVTWDGWMIPCGMVTASKVDLVNNPFHETWKNLAEESTKLLLSGICKNCPDIKLCYSCAAMAQSETGTVAGVPRYLCETVREMKKIAESVLKG